MPQSILELIFKTSHQGSGGKQAAAELKELKGDVGELTKGFLGMDMGTMSAVGAVLAAGAAAKQVIGDYQAYGEQIRTLTAITGTGSEETSRLMQAFDDLGVSSEEFATIAEQAAKKGFVFTTENVAKLADKYNALGDQTAKNKLLTDTLGKAALGAAKAFEAGGDAIREAAAAQADGMIITEKQAAEIEKLRQNQDMLNDSVEALKNKFASALVPVLNEAISAFMTLSEWNQKIQQTLKDHSRDVVNTADSYADYRAEVVRAAEAAGYHIGRLDDQAYAVKGNSENAKRLREEISLLTEGEWNAMRATKGVSDGFSDVGTKVKDLESTFATHTSTVVGVKESYWRLHDEMDKSQGSMSTLSQIMKDETKKAADDLALSMQTLTKELLFQRASAGLTKDEQTALARALGLIDDKTQAAILGIERYSKMLQNHEIDQETYNRLVKELGQYLGAIPPEVNTAVNVRFNYSGTPFNAGDYTPNNSGSKGPPVVTDYSGGHNGSSASSGVASALDWYSQIGARAAGGPVRAGQVYLVGENGPELFMPTANGQVINNNNTQMVLNLHSSSPSEPIISDFRMMQSLLGGA